MALRADDVDLGRDRDLVARFQNGDPEAFDDLYRRYFDRLHRYCMRHTSDAHEAEEIAQESFARALRCMDGLRGERRFYPWMTVIAKRLVIDRHRKLSRVELTDEPDLGSVEPDVDHLFRAVDAAHVRAAMANLGPRHREVLLLREAEGRSYVQIAEHLEVPVTTVEALLHRARKALRREFAAVGGERRGLLGLPVLGWLTTRAADLRAKLGDRWVEVGAALTPVAVGAATAVIVLVPGGDASPPAAAQATTARPAAVSTVVDAPADPLPEPATATITVPASATPTDRPTPAAPATPPAPPAVEAGPVDVFTGPDGTDRARDSAEDMPVNESIGPVTGGFDTPAVVEDAVQFADDTMRFIAPDAPGGTP